MEANKTQRLMHMLDLMRRPGGVRADDLLDRLQIDVRSLRRYIAELREQAIPVVDEGRGTSRVLSVDPRWRRAGVTLSLTEVLSLHFGRRLFDFLDGTSFAADLDNAIERLQPAMSRSHDEVSRSLDKVFVAVPEHAKRFDAERSETIDEVVTALLYRHPLSVRYRRADERTGDYELQPYTLAIYRQGLYILARDVASDAIKTFAIERIEEITRDPHVRFEVPATWDPEEWLQHAFGILNGPPEGVRVAFSPRVRTLATERRWHRTQAVRTLDDGWTEVSMTVAATAELVAWILSFGADVRVLAPTSLRGRVAGEIRAMAAAYAEVA